MLLGIQLEVFFVHNKFEHLAGNPSVFFMVSWLVIKPNQTHSQRGGHSRALSGLFPHDFTVPSFTNDFMRMKGLG